MTPDQARKKLIARIHIIKNGMPDMDDGLYREILRKLTQKSSTKDMTLPELQQVVSHFDGLCPPQTHSKRRRHSGKNIQSDISSSVQAHRAKINALLIHFGLPEAYADGIARRMFNVDSFLFCDARQCRAIIAALVKKYGTGNA